MTPLVAGLLVGLAGGGHCLLMCGPLAALAVPRAHPPAYHLGRIATYLALGLAAGALGGLVTGAGFGRSLSIVAGLLLIGHAVGRGLGHRATGSAVGRVVTRALTAAARRTPAIGIARPFAFGVLNGLLPCGLVYGAIVGATGFGSAANGTSFMLGFGAGTVPVLAGAGVLARLARRLPAPVVGRAVPVALALTGLLLIGRGVMPAPADHLDHTASVDNLQVSR